MVMVLVMVGLPVVLVNATVALRARVVGLAWAVIVTVLLAVPVVGVTVSQVEVVQVPAMRQSVLEDTVMVWLPPVAAEGFQVVAGATVRVAVTPA